MPAEPSNVSSLRRLSSAGVCLRLPRKFRSLRPPLVHDTTGLRSQFFI